MSTSSNQHAGTIRSSLGPMRPVTYEEMTSYLSEIDAQVDWNEVCRFARQLYGARAHHVEIATSQEFDDEKYYTAIDDVVVYDAQHEPLPYDLALPYWQQAEVQQGEHFVALLEKFEQALREEEARNEEPLSPLDREQMLQDLARDYVKTSNLYVDEFELPREDGAYYLDQPPPMTKCPTFYVLVQAAAPGTASRDGLVD